MSDWDHGYVTDIPYTEGYYRPQSPQAMQLACALGGVTAPDMAGDSELSYLELGCGMGIGALLIAASNPAWRITAVDFNPAHIAHARALAVETGITNAHFLEADLSTLAEDSLSALPDADVVSLHGVWSWVPPPVRAGIVRVLRSRVRAGGIVHISYNALPGWQGALGLQRLLRDAGRSLAQRSDRQAQAGIGIVRSLKAAGTPHLTAGLAGTLLERADGMPVEYLAHELMNASWQPCFHADVVEALAEAKLDWVAASQPLENFPALMLSDEQRAVRDRFDDPLLRELIKDMCLERGLRHDVFVRGARRLDPVAHKRTLGSLMVALTVVPDRFSYAAVLPAGTAAMSRVFYGPMVNHLAAGPCRIRDLLALPDIVGDRDNPGEVVSMLVGTEQALPVSGKPAPPTPAADRLNAHLATRARLDTLDRKLAFATGGCGSPLPASLSDLYVRDRLRSAAAPDPAAWAASFVPESTAGKRAPARALFEESLGRRPIWDRFGLM